jgi:hypothetical protein
MGRVFLIVVDHGLDLAVYADLPVSAAIDGLTTRPFSRCSSLTTTGRSAAEGR